MIFLTMFVKVCCQIFLFHSYIREVKITQISRDRESDIAINFWWRLGSGSQYWLNISTLIWFWNSAPYFRERPEKIVFLKGFLTFFPSRNRKNLAIAIKNSTERMREKWSITADSVEQSKKFLFQQKALEM